MLKVVIVEDNPLTVRSLVETIDWSSLGCEVVGTAFDGESGKKLILETEPDILLTDIRMPQSNGMDMIEADVVGSFYVFPGNPNIPPVIKSRVIVDRFRDKRIRQDRLSIRKSDLIALRLDPAES